MFRIKRMIPAIVGPFMIVGNSFSLSILHNTNEAPAIIGLLVLGFILTYVGWGIDKEK